MMFLLPILLNPLCRYKLISKIWSAYDKIYCWSINIGNWINIKSLNFFKVFDLIAVQVITLLVDTAMLINSVLLNTILFDGLLTNDISFKNPSRSFFKSNLNLFTLG